MYDINKNIKKSYKSQKRLKFFFKIFSCFIFQLFDSVFLGYYNFKLIKVSIIILKIILKLDFLYKIKLKIEQKALKLGLDYIKKAKLNNLAMKIIY